MVFVWSYWYIVLAILLIGAIGCVVAFILMDKKDREIISSFVKDNSQPVEEKKPEKIVVSVAPKEEEAPAVEEKIESTENKEGQE